MAGHADVYRCLLRLYPKAFRHDYADDLVQTFTDLIARDGPSRTWRRIAVDVAVTVPRYRLETVMSPRHTNTTLYIATAAVAVAAVISITTALFPGGAALLLAAAVLTVVSASRLARSTRPPDTQRRRHLLIAATTFAATCVISTAVFWIELSNDASWHGGKLVVYNAVFFITAIGALICLVVGLRTPHAPTNATRIG
jgi:hypothetical protein